jgi:DNA-binding MarR family transcriptional regulator
MEDSLGGFIRMPNRADKQLKVGADGLDRLRRNEKKWTRPLMNAGWLTVPEVLLRYQLELKLDPVDVNILFHLASYWWYAHNLPHPSKKTLAGRMGVDPSTIRRHIAKMEKRGLIKRNARYGADKRREANDYDFSGLIKVATPFAKEMVEKKRQKKKEAAAKLTRKRVTLKAVA